MHSRRRRVLENLIARGPYAEAHPSTVHEPAARRGVPVVDVRAREIAPELWSLVSFDLAAKHRLVPLVRTGTTLTVAMADPANIFAIDDVKFLTGCNIDVVAADEDDVVAVIEDGRRRDEAVGVEECVPPDETVALVDEALRRLTPLTGSDDAPIAKLVRLIVREAVRTRAHEIVIEPRVHGVSVWFARGGALEEAMTPPLKLLYAMVGRLRAMAGAAGWFTLAGVVDVDARFYPTRFGTQVSLRLFGSSPVPLAEDAIELPAFADAARIEPAAGNEPGRVDLHTTKGWRPTWTYPMSRHAWLVAAARGMEHVDVTDDECANGVRLFLRKRS